MENKIFSIRTPSTATLVGRNVPGGKQGMRVRPIDRNLPKRASSTVKTSDSEPNYGTIERPNRVERCIGRGDKLVGVRAVAVCQEQVGAVGINNPLAIRRPGGGLTICISQFAR